MEKSPKTETIPIPSQNAPRPTEEIRNGNSISFDGLALMYHGLRATILERGIAGETGLPGNQNKIEQAENRADFYEDLQDKATTVLNEGGGVNLPPYLPERTPFGHIASANEKSITRMEKIFRGEDVETGTISPILHDISRGPNANPNTWLQRRAERKVAKKITKVRNLRKAQESTRKSFDDLGLHRKYRTKVAKKVARFNDWRDYKDGTIDSFELAQRKTKRKTMSVRSSRHGLISPPVMIHRSMYLDMLQDGNILKKSLPKKLEKKAEKARQKQDKYVTRQAKLERKLDAHKEKKGTIRINQLQNKRTNEVENRTKLGLENKEIRSLIGPLEEHDQEKIYSNSEKAAQHQQRKQELEEQIRAIRNNGAPRRTT